MPQDATGCNEEPVATASESVKEAPLAHSIVGLFPDRASAEAAIQDLKAAGYNPDRIGIVMRDRGETRGVADDQGVNATAGAVTGGVTGGTAGAQLAATGALAVPGVGPFITGGILASLVGGTAGWLIGGLVGRGVPREEAEYYQGRVEQGEVLVTVDALGRHDEAREILLRNGAEGEHNRGAGAMSGTAGTGAHPAGTMRPYPAGVRDAYPQQYPPAGTGVAPGTMADAPGSEQEMAGAARPEMGIGSQLGGVQPSAVSDQTDDAWRDDLLHRTPDPRGGRIEGMRAPDRSRYGDTVASAGAQEGADYNRGARRERPDRPVTDADIIADAEGQRRRTDPDLDVPTDADRQASEQSGLA